MTTELNAQVREGSGTSFSRRLRKSAMVPAILYGSGIKSKNLSVQLGDVEKILRTKKGQNTLIQLKVENDQNYTVLIKDTQGDALTRRLTHVDFWHVDQNREVEVAVPTRLEGKAPGLLQGGLLDHISYTVKLLCRADAIPDEIVADVSQLGLNQNIHLADLPLPEGVKRRPDYNPTIASLFEEKIVIEEVAPVVAVSEAPAEEGKEGAKPAEGATPAKGEAKGSEKAPKAPKAPEKSGEKSGGKEKDRK